MKQNELKHPFFAQFLEAQARVQRPNEANMLVWPPVTLPIMDEAHTHKYPSDGDDDMPTTS